MTRTNEEIAREVAERLMQVGAVDNVERYILAALNEATAERDTRILQLIGERDTWRHSAEQKIAIRREIEAALGIETGDANDDALRKGLEAIRALKAKARTP